MLTKEEWRRMEGFDSLPMKPIGAEEFDTFMLKATKAAFVTKEFKNELINHEIPEPEVHRLMRMIDMPNLLADDLTENFTEYNVKFFNLSQLLAIVWTSYSETGFSDKQATDFTIVVYQDYLKNAERSVIYGTA